jgi:putative sigma-54 modulation protein
VRINISARHGHLSAATQERITEKVEKLAKYFDRLTAVEVTVDLNHRETPSVEVRVSAEHADDFVAVDSSTNVIAAVDSVLHKVEKQVRKHKDKLTGRRAPGLKHLESPAETEPE